MMAIAYTCHAEMRMRQRGIRSGDVVLAGVSDVRLAADYNVHARFTSEETRYECRQAREFVKRIERYLLDNGLTDEELGPETNSG